MHCWLECKLVQPLWEAVWKLLRRLKIEHGPAVLLLGVSPKETEPTEYIQKEVSLKELAPAVVGAGKSKI